MMITEEHMKMWYELSHPNKEEDIDKKAFKN